MRLNEFSAHKIFISAETLNTINNALYAKRHIWRIFPASNLIFSNFLFWHWWKIKSKAIKFNIGWWRKLFRKHENASREVNFSLWMNFSILILFICYMREWMYSCSFQIRLSLIICCFVSINKLDVKLKK